MNNDRRFNSPLKKIAYSLILITSIFTFVSCENFLQGADVKEEISKAIEYNNAPKYPIKFRNSDNKSGTITSPGYGDFEKKITDTFKISFEPSSDYKFIKWEAVIEGIASGEKVSDYIEFENAKSANTWVTFKKSAANITIRPICPPRLTYTFALSEGDQPRDSSIEFVFNQELSPDCFTIKTEINNEDPEPNPDDENTELTEPDDLSENNEETNPADTENQTDVDDSSENTESADQNESTDTSETSTDTETPTTTGRARSAEDTDPEETPETTEPADLTEPTDPTEIEEPSENPEEPETNPTEDPVEENPNLTLDASSFITIQNLPKEDTPLYFNAPEIVGNKILFRSNTSNGYIDVQNSTKKITINIPKEKILYVYTTDNG